jgi:hypothetical protein
MSRNNFRWNTCDFTFRITQVSRGTMLYVRASCMLARTEISVDRISVTCEIQIGILDFKRRHKVTKRDCRTIPKPSGFDLGKVPVRVAAVRVTSACFPKQHIPRAGLARGWGEREGEGEGEGEVWVKGGEREREKAKERKRKR